MKEELQCIQMAKSSSCAFNDPVLQSVWDCPVVELIRCVFHTMIIQRFLAPKLLFALFIKLKASVLSVPSVFLLDTWLCPGSILISDLISMISHSGGVGEAQRAHLIAL